MDHRNQYGFRCSTDHRNLLRWFNSENEPSFISNILVFSQIQGDHLAGQYDCRLSLRKLQAAAHYPTVPTQQRNISLFMIVLPHTCHYRRISNSVSLHCELPSLFLHLSHLSIAYSFIIVILETAVCHTVYFPQTALHTNTHCKESLVLLNPDS